MASSLNPFEDTPLGAAGGSGRGLGDADKPLKFAKEAKEFRMRQPGETGLHNPFHDAMDSDNSDSELTEQLTGNSDRPSAVLGKVRLSPEAQRSMSQAEPPLADRGQSSSPNPFTAGGDFEGEAPSSGPAYSPVQGAEEVVEEDPLRKSFVEWAGCGDVKALLVNLKLVMWPDAFWKDPSPEELATDADIKTAYRKAIRLCHPDKLTNAPPKLKEHASAVFDRLKKGFSEMELVNRAKAEFGPVAP